MAAREAATERAAFVEASVSGVGVHMLQLCCLESGLSGEGFVFVFVLLFFWKNINIVFLGKKMVQCGNL